jgi:hypothetical protein
MCDEFGEDLVADGQIRLQARSSDTASQRGIASGKQETESGAERETRLTTANQLIAVVQVEVAESSALAWEVAPSDSGGGDAGAGAADRQASALLREAMNQSPLFQRRMNVLMCWTTPNSGCRPLRSGNCCLDFKSAEDSLGM